MLYVAILGNDNRFIDVLLDARDALQLPQTELVYPPQSFHPCAPPASNGRPAAASLANSLCRLDLHSRTLAFKRIRSAEPGHARGQRTRGLQHRGALALRKATVRPSSS